MIVDLRRRAAHILARLVLAVDPDPPVTFTIKRRLDVEYPDLVNLVSGHIVGKGVAGRGFSPGDGIDFSY